MFAEACRTILVREFSICQIHLSRPFLSLNGKSDYSTATRHAILKAHSKSKSFKNFNEKLRTERLGAGPKEEELKGCESWSHL